MGKRTLEHDMIKNIDPWPQDWDLHLMKTFQLYFVDTEERTNPPVIWHKMHTKYSSHFEEVKDTSNVSYDEMRDNIDLWSIDFRCIFTCKEYFYLTLAIRKNENEIISNVFVFTHTVGNYSELDEGQVCIPGKSGYMVAIPIDAISSESPFILAQAVETIIVNDYWKRNNGGGEDDNSPATDPSDLLSV